MSRHLSVVLFVSLAVFSIPSPAQTAPQAPTQGMDPDYAARVKEWTTKPEFGSPLVDHLPASSGVPSPKDVLGHHIGAPKELTYYADVLRYYDILAAHSGRVKVIRIGKRKAATPSSSSWVQRTPSPTSMRTVRISPGLRTRVASPTQKPTT